MSADRSAMADLLYQAGPVLLDPARRLVTDAAGRRIRLEPQHVAVFAVLVREWPEVVHQRTLEAEVAGPGGTLSDENIRVVVHSLRGLLPLDEHGRPMIVNIRPFGYTLNVAVEQRPRVGP